MTIELNKLISDDKLTHVTEALPFADGQDMREMLKTALLKVAAGYSNGYTVTTVLLALGLCYDKSNEDGDSIYYLTHTGQEYLFVAYVEHLK